MGRHHLGGRRNEDKLDHLDDDWSTDEEQAETRFARGTLQTEKLADRDLDTDDDVLTEIVHDLKNPLSTISLEMCLLADKLGDSVPLDMRTAITRVQENVVYLGRLVQDILDSCALDSGSFTLHRTRTELCALVERAIDRMVSTRDRPRVYVEAKQHVILELDELRIERVVANLVQNALKYAPRSTGIVIRVDVAHRVCVSVIDAGPGLSDDEMRRAFGKYWRAKGTIHEGSGLGLHVAKRIIEAHGGTIGVDRIPMGGSRFFFELPR